MLIWIMLETSKQATSAAQQWNLAFISSSHPQSFHDFTRQSFITDVYLLIGKFCCFWLPQVPLEFLYFFLFADMRSAVEGGSICSDNSIKKEDHSSHSSTCVVDTTTKGEDLAGWRGKCKSCGCCICVQTFLWGHLRSFLCCGSDLILRSSKLLVAKWVFSLLFEVLNKAIPDFWSVWRVLTARVLNWDRRKGVGTQMLQRGKRWK